MSKWRTISYQEWLDVPRIVVWIEFRYVNELKASKAEGVKAGRKWGYRTERGLAGGMLPAYEIELMPETITCNGVEISAPLRVAPEKDTHYWVASPLARSFCSPPLWHGDSDDELWLARGLIHATREAAAAHGRAMCGVQS